MSEKTKPNVMIWLDRYIEDYFHKNLMPPQSVELHPSDCFEIISHEDMRMYGLWSIEYQFKHPEVVGVYRGVRLIAVPELPQFTREDELKKTID